jgi:hypothetical protein
MLQRRMEVPMDSCHLCPENTCTLSVPLASSADHLPCTPRAPRWKYDFECSIPANKFMHWTKGELRTIRLGKSRKQRGKKSYKMCYKEYRIPAPYDRIICQLAMEDLHAMDHDSHESRQRQAYAREVLDEFGKELDKLQGYSDAAMVDFRSAVLTPLLQRQALGVHDAYGPSIIAAIGSDEELTIQAVTKFYLQDDPTDPALIPSYRRNILYLPDARWHLGRVLGNPSDTTLAGATRYYNMVRENHDRIMEYLKTHGLQEYDEYGTPLLTCVEISVIIEEGLDLFFADELNKQVRHMPLPLL